MTKKELQEYRLIVLEAQNLIESIESIQTTLENVTQHISTDESSHQAFLTDKQSELIIKKLEIEDELNKRYLNALIKLKSIEKAISTLTDPLERTILRYRYIQGLKWTEICIELNYSWKQTHRLHSRALTSIAQIKT